MNEWSALLHLLCVPSTHNSGLLTKHNTKHPLTQNIKLNTNKRYFTHFIPPSTFPMSAGCLSAVPVSLQNVLMVVSDWHSVTITVQPGHNTCASRSAATVTSLSLSLSLSLSDTHKRTHTKHRRIRLNSFQTAPFNNTEGD